jgi:stress response protein YsnF/sporulation protein YlmC with PRC-barrel domain
MAVHNDDLARLDGAEIIGGDGEKLGTVAGVYFDNDTDQPEWVAVRSGLFGLNESLVPLATAELRGDVLQVPFDKEQLKRAPHHEPGRELSPQDEIDLFRHYGISYDTWADTQPPHATTSGTIASSPDEELDLPGDVTDQAMTRSEEQLRVHTESRAVGRVRLRKHIVTEYQQITVPVRREEIRIEREPVAEAATFADGDAGSVGAGSIDKSVADHVDPGTSRRVDVADVGDDEKEIILYAERPVVRTETVAVERIRVGRRSVTEQKTVGGEVRREEIEVDTDTDTDHRR